MYSDEIGTPEGIPSTMPTSDLPCDSPAVKYRITGILLSNAGFLKVHEKTEYIHYAPITSVAIRERITLKIKKRSPIMAAPLDTERDVVYYFGISIATYLIFLSDPFTRIITASPGLNFLIED